MKAVTTKIPSHTFAPGLKKDTLADESPIVELDNTTQPAKIAFIDYQFWSENNRNDKPKQNKAERAKDQILNQKGLENDDD